MKIIKGLMTKVLNRLGFDGNDLSLKSALSRCRKRNPLIGTVIDVGASDGRWSLAVRKHFPQASFFLVEAQDAHEKALRKVKGAQPRFDYLISAAGDTEGTIYFDAGDLFGGVASHEPLEENCISVPVVTIDALVRKRNLFPPFLLKLDTHGFEVPIFEGARQTLEKTALIVVEVYNFKLTESSLRFHEMCAYLEERGFRCIDMSEPMHRFSDGALWQMDLFFIPADSKEFASNSYEGTPA
jgi:FkbM family methyltransferase